MLSPYLPIIVGILEIITGIGIITFWILFFSTDWLHPDNPPEGYFLHERSFVYPDSLLAIGLITSGILLILKIPLGGFLSLVCAGGLMFLGIIDLAYDYQNGMFKGGLAEALGNAAIDLWVLVFGLFLTIWFTR